MNKELVLLSDSFANFLETIINKENDPIIIELLRCHYLIINYNLLKDDNIIKDKIKELIDSKLTDFGRQLTIRLNSFEISFLPKNKLPIYKENGIWSRENRQTGKPVRIIQKILKTKFSNAQYEVFNNLFRSYFLTDAKFKVIDGEDIRKYYLVDNNIELATLGNSCMRYSSCQDFLDVYVDNCKMLILLRPDINKIIGRALLWKIDNSIYMDRVYYSYDYIYPMFIDYAKSNNWYIRNSNCLLDSGDTQYWKGPDDNYQDDKLKYLFIKVGIYSELPYIDSFRYYKSGVLYDYPPDSDYECCDCTDGSTSVVNTYIVECNVCGCEEEVYEGYEPDNLMYSDHDDCYYCIRCGQYIEYIDDVCNKDDLVNVILCNADEIKLPIWYVDQNASFKYNEELNIWIENE